MSGSSSASTSASSSGSSGSGSGSGSGSSHNNNCQRTPTPVLRRSSRQKRPSAAARAVPSGHDDDIWKNEVPSPSSPSSPSRSRTASSRAMTEGGEEISTDVWVDATTTNTREAEAAAAMVTPIVTPVMEGKPRSSKKRDREVVARELVDVLLRKAGIVAVEDENSNRRPHRRPHRTGSSSSSSSSCSATTKQAKTETETATSTATATRTKGNWCLREGLLHIVLADNGSLSELVERCGAPHVYVRSLSEVNQEQNMAVQCRHQSHHDDEYDDDDDDKSEISSTQIGNNENNLANLDDDDEDAIQNMKAPSNCFESLCRIIAGQQLAGAAAQAVWKRLCDTCRNSVTPRTILRLASEGLEQHLQKPSGLSHAKARSIVDLATHFEEGKLAEDILLGPVAVAHETSEAMAVAEKTVRDALLAVRGLGPWSCDMFFMFTLEHPNILPLGDLGVRKGLMKHFRLRGSGSGGTLCPKKDFDKMHAIAKPFAPYQSLLAYYMWRAIDIKDFEQSQAVKEKKKRK